MSGALETDSVLAGYRVTGLLGRGGMGFVYEAEHLLLRRKAALKTLAPELGGGADFRERFIRESQTVASIDHPNIIPIYDAGDHEGLVYIAMRYVKGPDLEKLIKERRHARPARGAVDPRAGRGRPRRSPHPRGHPPRRQARERDDRGRVRAHLPDGLRHRKAGRQPASAG